MAPRGFLMLSSLPSSSPVPESILSAPKTARASSVRPAPTSPAKPRISPERTPKEQSLSTLPRVMPLTRRSTSPISVSGFGYRLPISRPTISLTSLSSSSSEAGRVSTTRPSRMTVTRSAMRKISSSLCEMYRIAMPCEVRSLMTPKRSSISFSASEPVGVGVQANPLQQTPCLLGLGPAVHEPEAARLAAHVEVLGYREVGGQGELLVDHRHPQGLRVARAVELDGLAGDLDLAPARPLDLREELHQGGLAGPVLPGHDVDLARHDLQVHAVHREDPWELLGDAAEPDYRLSCIGRRHLLLLLASPSISRGWPAASSEARS